MQPLPLCMRRARCHEAATRPATKPTQLHHRTSLPGCPHFRPVVCSSWRHEARPVASPAPTPRHRVLASPTATAGAKTGDLALTSSGSRDDGESTTMAEIPTHITDSRAAPALPFSLQSRNGLQAQVKEVMQLQQLAQDHRTQQQLQQKLQEDPPTASPSAPASAALQSIDLADYPSSFPSRRLLCFVGITAGYMGLYFTRGSLTYCAPVLLADPSLGMSITDLGLMTSAFPLAYGFSKFFGGVLGARFSSHLMLGGGLLLTALVNLALGFCNSVHAFTGLWFLNGCLQGIGAPASASLLTRWFASKERGTYWGLWNIGANLGGIMTPLLVGWMANHYGWQFGMWAPGAVGLSLALFCLATVRDTPAEAGYAPHLSDAAQEAELAIASSGSSSSSGSSGRVTSGGGQQAEGEAAKAKAAAGGNNNIKDALVQALQSPGVWLLALTYFFVYIVRQGATSWLMMYLIQTKGAANAAEAAFTVSGLELGGLLGGTLAGLMSDARIRSAAAEEEKQGSGAAGSGHVGRRVQIIMGYVCCTLLALLALRAVPASSQLLQWAVIAALGFTIYGPQMLIGLCGAELVSKSAVGASQGILGLVAYMGAANAGVPLSYVLKHHSWDGYFAVMACACVAALLLLAPLANARSFVQVQRLQLTADKKAA